jgi:cytochrome c-type biogenesis protein CcmH/NrfF
MRRALAVLAVALAALAAALPATASEERPTLAELEGELICPTCNTTLALSNAPIADRMREFIRQRIAAGDTKTEIKDALVAEFGEEVLAAPPKEGFNPLAWVLPLAGIAAAGVVVALLARRWVTAGRRRAAVSGDDETSNGRVELNPELARRLDEELARFDG